MSRLTVALILLHPAALSAAEPALTANVDISSTPVSASKSKPTSLHFGFQQGAGSQGRDSVGVGAGLSEGKPLEMMLWSGGGAIAGSLAGPLGTVIGAASGAVVGLLVSVLIVPHNAPESPPK